MLSKENLSLKAINQDITENNEDTSINNINGILLRL
jgi:hypothetical protein